LVGSGVPVCAPTRESIVPALRRGQAAALIWSLGHFGLLARAAVVRADPID
jgi:hypothetical protein